MALAWPCSLCRLRRSLRRIGVDSLSPSSPFSRGSTELSFECRSWVDDSKGVMNKIYWLYATQEQARLEFRGCPMPKKHPMVRTEKP